MTSTAVASTVLTLIVVALIYYLARRAYRRGVFYADRDDPALLVPKRFGVGWSLNFGHPRAPLVLAVVLAVPLLTVLLAALL